MNRTHYAHQSREHATEMGGWTGITLFSGLGASSLAIRRAGGSVVTAVEREDAMAESLVLNGFPVTHMDIRGVDFTRFGRIDVLAGGPPCQPFSQGGRNAGQEDERDMIPEFIRAVEEARPELFILENVRGLMSPRHKDYLEHRLQQFRDLGYIVEARVLDCADYGVAQSRKRLFIVGRQAGVGAPRLPRKRDRQITMAEALGWNPFECQVRNQEAPEPARDRDKCLWPLHRPSTTVVGSFRPEVQAAPGYRSAGDGPRQNAPGSVVTTFEERLVLQGLPRDWKVSGGIKGKGSQAKRDLQVGNSCPPIVLQQILAANGFN